MQYYFTASCCCLRVQAGRKIQMRMTKRNRILTIIFAFIVLLELLGRLLDYIILEYFVLPLIMIWIAVYFLLNARKSSFRTGVLIAFFFSWVGGIFLIFSDGYNKELFFYGGALGFFLAQVAYIFVFSLSAENSIKGLLLRNPLLTIPLAGYSVLIYLFLLPVLEGAVVYIVLLNVVSFVGMSLAALNRRDRVNYNSFKLVFIGSLLFLLSESLIAINMFHTSIPYAGFLIMLTFITAQYLIMHGLILEREQPGNKN